MENRPVLWPELEIVYGGFIQLSYSRSAGFSSNPITTSDIKAWLDIHGINELEQRARIYDLLLHMDVAYLTHAREESEREKKNKKPKKNKSKEIGKEKE